MSAGFKFLHSHSGLEKTVKDKDLYNKSCVLIDKEYADLFSDISSLVKPFTKDGVMYYKVPVFAFIKKGGIFKNLNK